MREIELGENNKIVLETTLSKGQVAKFDSSIRHMIVEDGAAYIPIDELHGVLLTNSRERARTIVNNKRDVVKAYLVRDPIRFAKYGVSAAIKPVGLYNLLEALAEEYPKKASDYRASLALLAYIIAQDPRIALSASIKAKNEEAKKNSVVAKLKRKHNVCQLSREFFTDDDEKHVHHIEGESEEPALAADESNLIVIKGNIHDDYHCWLRVENLPITKSSLVMYAKIYGYSLAALGEFYTLFDLLDDTP